MKNSFKEGAKKGLMVVFTSQTKKGKAQVDTCVFGDIAYGRAFVKENKAFVCNTQLVDIVGGN